MEISAVSALKVFDNIQDGLLAFDREWNFTYTNREGARTLGRDNSYLLGRNLWLEFPELEETTFGRLYKEAMRTQVFREYEDFYQPFQKWFNVRVYPSSDGLLLFFQDINARKLEEKALRESKKYFQNVAENVPVIIWMSDAAGNCTYLNPQWQNFTGQSSAAGLGEGWLEFIHPHDVDAVRGGMAQDPRGNIPTSSTFRLRRHDLEYRWSVISSIPRHSEDSRFQGFIGTVNDVHEKILATDELEKQVKIRTRQLEEKNEALNQQRDFMETVLDVSLDLLAVYDPQGRFISFNRRCEEEFKRKASDVLGKTFLEVFPYGASSPVYADLVRALKGEAVRNYQYQAISPGRYFESVTTPLFNGRGELYCVVAAAHEITPLMEATRRLEHANQQLLQQKDFAEALLNSSVDVICVFDAELRFLAFNKKCQEAYGMRPDMIGKNIVDLFPLTKDSLTVNCLNRALRGEEILGVQHQSVIVDKQYESFFIPLLNQDKEVYAVMMIHHDVTEKAAAASKIEVINRSLEEKNRELERSNNELAQFAYVASHDLQEPLRKIQTFSDLLENNIDNPSKAQQYLRKISLSASRMASLIRDVLHFSQVARTNDLFIQTDLNSILEEVKQDFELIIHERSVSIVHGTLPFVNGIPLHLHQLFSNLIGNAIKFCRTNPVVEIRCEVVEGQEGKKYYRLSFRDNGIGFDQQYADRIFTVFQRLNSQHEYAGSGIGLAICKKIVENHGGFIKASSKPEAGSTFDVFLPVN